MPDNTILLAAGALLLEAALGYPDALVRRLGHPVIVAGAAIAWLDRILNRGRWRRARGIVALVALLTASTGGGWAVQAALLRELPRPLAVASLALLASSLLAQRSLWTHVRSVATGLRRGLADGREAVSHIVGRDPESLDETGVARAALESLAENFSDAVVAPALWCALLGLPGLAMYKTVNTADSMIGHRTPRHERFGWAAARFDDLVNLPASRLAWLLIAVASGRRAGAAALAGLRFAGKHRSPNAGWPESAMAGALGLRLAGPRVYGGVPVEDAWMGSGRADAGAAEIDRGLALYRRACVIWVAALCALGLLLH